MDWKESSFRRAVRDTIAAQKTVRFLWLVEAVLLVAGTAWLNSIAPDSALVREKVARAVGGALLGLFPAVLAILVFNFIRAPYWQRNEARLALAEAELEDGRPIPVSPVFTMHILDNYDFGVLRIDSGKHWIWNDDKAIQNPEEGWFRFLQLNIVIAASPKTVVESIKVDFLGENGIKPLAWESEQIGAEVVRELEIPLKNAPTRGKHRIRLVANTGRDVRYVEDELTYPAPA